MKKLIVYDSVFGNTAKVAKIIKETIGKKNEAKMLRVNDFHKEELTVADLLIISSPTRVFEPTKDMIRRKLKWMN
jgi:flavodoxin